MPSQSLWMFPRLLVLALGLVSCNDLYNAGDSGDDTPHTIVYDANGSLSGTVPVDANSYAPGAIVTVLGNTGSLAKTGYILKGWTLYANGNGTVHPAGEAFPMGRKNLKLYAKWVLPPGSAVWAKAPSGSDQSMYNAVAADSSGNVYAAGYFNGTGTFTFGTGVSVAGNASTSSTAVLVKFDSSGNALWAKVPSGSNDSTFASVTTDPSGNVYVTGGQGVGTFSYGTGVSAAGVCPEGNTVLVKYDSSGNALWARVPDQPEGADFTSVSTDSSGDVYVAGGQYNTGTYTYGSGVSAAGSYAGNNAVLVKYDASGNALWARVPSVNNYTFFFSVAIDGSGNAYVTGNQSGTTAAIYGSGVSAAGSYIGNNTVLVKYDASGNALWARVPSATATVRFLSVSADSSGNAYAAGNQSGTGAVAYGGSVSVKGTNSSANAVLVKYDSSGNARWAELASGSNNSVFSSVKADSAGNAFAAGYQYGTGTYTYDTDVSVSGVYSGSNSVLVKYDSAGNALWAQTPSSSSIETQFQDVVLCGNGYSYAIGYQSGNSEVVYGTGISATGSYSGGNNAVLLTYMR